MEQKTMKSINKRRTIVPIYIENRDILVITKDDLDLIKKDDEKQNIYNRMLMTGDIYNLLYAMAQDKELETLEKEREALLKSHDFTIKSKQYIELIGARYTAEPYVAFECLEGYHRQKSVIDFETLTITSDIATIRYVTLSANGFLDGVLYCKGEVAFEGVIFDRISVVIEDGAQVSFIDCHFSGTSKRAAIIQKGQGIIKEIKNIEHESNRFHYDIEHCNINTCGSIIDLSSFDDFFLIF